MTKDSNEKYTLDLWCFQKQLMSYIIQISKLSKKFSSDEHFSLW